MAGDINLFFESDQYKNAELMVMTAQEHSRRKGIAKEACLMMMRYAVENLHTEQFIVKINESNANSIKLFEALGFHEERRIEAFQEVHLILQVRNLCLYAVSIR